MVMGYENMTFEIDEVMMVIMMTSNSPSLAWRERSP
jgi:hypothetical protein